MNRFFSLLLVFLSGCVANSGLSSMADSESNIYNMSRLSLGMKQCEVLQIMRRPYRHEAFEIGDVTYDVWFYVTQPTALGQSRMVPQNLTPLTFKNGELVGWGYAYYHYVAKKEMSQNTQSTQPDKTEENEGLEKALQMPASPNKIEPKAGTKPRQTTPKPAEPSAIKQPTPSTEKKESPKKSSPTTTTRPPQDPSRKPEPVKKDPLTAPSTYKPNSPNPPALTPPQKNNPPPQQTPPKNTPPKPNHSVSMSPSPKTPPPPPKKPAKKTPPIQEEDEEMLEDAQDQNFNQTSA